MFKNITPYLFDVPSLAGLEEAARQMLYLPCAPSAASSFGWVPPRGEENAPMVETVAGQIVMRMRVEHRNVPASAIAKKVKELAAKIEELTGRKPGRKQTKDLKEQALHELLPNAFSKTKDVWVWLDRKTGRLIVGAIGKVCEVPITSLVRSVEGMAIRTLQSRTSPAVAMTTWLQQGEAPAGFSIDRECELHSCDEMRSVVRYTRHALDTNEVREHIAQGKAPTRMAMTYAGRVSFVLTECGELRRIDFDDVVLADRAKHVEQNAEAFDADVAIATGELQPLITDLLDALGGELQPGDLPDELTQEQAAG